MKRYSTVDDVLQEALRRAKADNSIVYNWSKCSEQDRIEIVRLYLGVIIIELELNEFAHDLDQDSLTEIKHMATNAWTCLDGIYQKLPEPTDDFILNRIKTKLCLKEEA